MIGIQAEYSRIQTPRSTLIKNHPVQDNQEITQTQKEQLAGYTQHVTTSLEKSDLHYGHLLSPEQKDQLAELKSREQEVKAHEQAHQSVGGKFAGGISYDLQKGPDGQQYIVGGEVPIEMPDSNHPEDTITTMEQVRNAALAPANPSSQDMQVASKASQAILQAQSELRSEEFNTKDNPQFKRASDTYKQYQNAFMVKAEPLYEQFA